MKKTSIAVCGLPESGKSSFLAALWYLVFNQEITTNLVLGDMLPKDREYLNKISQEWVKGLPLNRTTLDEFHEIKIQLKSSTEDVELIIPDISGETWSSIWQSRSCSKVAVEWANESDAILLFAHADHIRAPIALDFIAALEIEPSETMQQNSKPWDATKSPTQVVLVEILQALANPPLGNQKKKLAIVLSAWDKVEEVITPENFLKTYLPLLHQFINFSQMYSEVKVIGVSATGGDLKKDEETNALLMIDKPSQRIKCVDGTSVDHDLTKVISWLMN